MLILVSALVCGIAMAAPAAQAGWSSSGHCTAAGTHCYDIQAWNMSYPTESVRGGIAYITSYRARVNEWASYAFIDNEMWVGFNENRGWVETGTTVGNNVDCCTGHAFIAHAKSEAGYGYEEYLYASSPTTETSWYRIDDTASNNNWCTYFGEPPINNLVYCLGGGQYTTYAPSLEAGIEAAQNTKPEDAGHQEVAAVFHDGSWHPWQGSKTKAKKYVDAEMCQTAWSGNPAAGNAEWWIC